jgi:hypothetical protein
MRQLPLSLTPPTGRRHGIVYTAPKSNSVGRAAGVPLQPTSNPRTSAQVNIANLAAFWNSLSPTQQALWGLDIVPPSTPYSAFIGINQLCATWGLFLFDAPPGFYSGPGITFAQPYAEPDGVHMTLATITAGVPSSPNELWLRYYLSVTPPTIAAGSSFVDLTSPANYFGSYGPITNAAVALFDITDQWMNFVGQWVPNACLDTASHISCGGASYAASYYATNQFGLVTDSEGSQPTVAQTFPGPGPIEAGICPLPTSPPYPWPTAAVFYA